MSDLYKAISGSIDKDIDEDIEIRTGEITADNGDGTYDVKIANADSAYPNVETLKYNAVFSVGEIVAIGFEYGCKEAPKILGHGKKIAQEPKIVEVDYSGEVVSVENIYVVYKKTSDSKYYLVGIESDDSITEIAELPELATGNNPGLVRILTDNNGNVYVFKQNENPYPTPFDHTLYKYNSSGILQVTKVQPEHEMFGFVTSNYLYIMIYNDDKIYKRNLSDLEVVETIDLTSGHRYYYLCFDGSGHLYTYDKDYAGGAAIVKWDLGGGVLDSHIQGIGLSAWADWALLGDNILHSYFGYNTIGSINVNLDSDMILWTLPGDIPSGQTIGIASNQTYWYVIGENTADNKLIVEKYNSAKILQSTIDISADYISGGYRNYHNAITAYPF